MAKPVDDPKAPLFDLFVEAARLAPAQPALVGEGFQTTYRQLAETIHDYRSHLLSTERSRVGVVLTPRPATVATLAALDALGAEVFLLGSRADGPALAAIAGSFTLAGILAAQEGGPSWAVPPSEHRQLNPSQPDAPPGGWVTLLTSGTTGKPKAVRHTWTSLLKPARRSDRYTGTRWLLAYPLHLYAGLQVFLQCCANRGTLIVLPDALEPTQVGACLQEHRAQYVSGTPSFWRKVLLFSPKQVLRQARLEQITLGGETVPEDLRASLRGTFPGARIAHIYATSELGRCFTVTDGRAGFPARFLEEPPEDGLWLRIVADELQVMSPNAMSGYDPAPA